MHSYVCLLVRLFGCLFGRSCDYLFVHMVASLPVCLSVMRVCLFACLFGRPFVCLSVWLLACLACIVCLIVRLLV